MESQIEPQKLFFQDDGLIPNHPSLPVLVYRSPVKKTESMEQLFASHGWGNNWTNGVYPYHHYHSNTHEALGVVSGTAMLQLGGPTGETVEVSSGDVLVLPAGTGHRRLSASSSFRISGGYPGGVSYNMRHAENKDRQLALEEIPSVLLPGTDPVYGVAGPLLRAWHIGKYS
ncbi:cupin domain-containing protein [Paenibacillus herberti]|uniref:Cupin type-2 domain-containing protein n=1 Tax=Paenibacillus herberti TaxID=1619309 RepID=A0A229NWY2_9BACL|nr:cupin domain-containing protein [Paenibacillus herberti]OXM14311.1 hypothetical protein CGZ75_15270 [Paenibacillus herberti]